MMIADLEWRPTEQKLGSTEGAEPLRLGLGIPKYVWAGGWENQRQKP